MSRLGITAKLLLHSAAILTALGTIITIFSVSQLRSLLYEEMIQRVEAQALNWIEANTAQIILASDSRTLSRLVGELQTRASIAYVKLLDADQSLQSSSGLGSRLFSVGERPPTCVRPPMCWKEMQDAAGHRYFQLTVPISASGTGMNPDLGTLFGAAAAKPTWGELRIGVDRQEFDRTASALAQKSLLLAAVLISGAIVLSFAWARPIVTPITRMGDVADAIAAGRLSERVSCGNGLRDEVGQLVRNFNRMAQRLEENRDEMHLLNARLEDKVRERTEELERANRKLTKLDQLKSDFMSTLSHELRTPLTSIKAYAEILLDSPTVSFETNRRFLDIIDKEANRMTRLISDLLSLEKIESGTTVWAFAFCDFTEIVRTSAAVLAPAAAEKNVAILIRYAGPQMVWADADRIQEVITNLMGNAIKYCGHAGQVDVRAQPTTRSGPNDSSGDYLLIEVSDNGPGVPSEEHDLIFTKFYQGRRNRSGGSGLGLAIAKEIVTHHQGEIWLESRPQRGSSFYFTLPLQPALPQANTERAATEN